MKTYQTFIVSISLFFVPLCLFAAQPTGEVIGWGNNVAGQVTGIPSIKYFTNELEFDQQFKKPIPAAIGVVRVGRQPLHNVAAIAAGDSHGLALRYDGTVYGWGWNTFGQATGIPTTSTLRVSNGRVTIAGRVLSNVTAIAAGRTHSVALKKDGTVVIWGALNSGRQLDSPPGVSNIVAVAAGWDGSLALRDCFKIQKRLSFRLALIGLVRKKARENEISG